MENLGTFEEGLVIPNQILLSPGVWNGKNYSTEEIERSYKLTNWEDPSVTTLIADHSDDDVEHLPRSIHDWQGQVENVRFEYPNLIGDVRVFDMNSITKLTKGKMKAGISVKVEGENFNENVCNFMYKNFSLVINPACKDAYIKLSQTEEKSNKVTFYVLNDLNELGDKKKKKGPGGHIPDGTGPHGSGEGPGNGKADGSGKLDGETQNSGIKGKPVGSDELKPREVKKKKSQSSKQDVQDSVKGGTKLDKMAEEETKQEIETSEEPNVADEKVEKEEESNEEKPSEEKEEEKSEELQESEDEEKSEESKEEPKEKSEEELSDEDVLKDVISKLQSRLKTKEELTNVEKLSRRVEKLEKLFSEKLSEITEKLSKIDSNKSTEKLSDNGKSKTFEKLSAEAKNNFTGISGSTVEFASLLTDKHKDFINKQ